MTRCLFLLLLLNSCTSSFINEKTSEISDLSTTCIESVGWENIIQEHSTDSIVDSELLLALKKIKEKPFPTMVLYFSAPPKELVAISTDYYSIRYIYNKSISFSVLDGFSGSLSNIEKKRIVKRVHNLLIKYQCGEGVKESMKIINNLDITPPNNK